MLPKDPEQTLLSIIFCLIFIGCGAFLCGFTVQERLRIRWYTAAALTVLLALIYFFLRVLTWLGTVPFLAIAIFVYVKICDVAPMKLVYLLMLVVSYLLFSNTVFYIFEGSAYTWDWRDFDTVLYGFATSMPPMTWLLRRRVWPALRDLQLAHTRWLWLVPLTFMSLNVILCSSHIQSLMTFRLSWPYTIITALFAIASAVVSFLMLDAFKKSEDVLRYNGDMQVLDVQLAAQAKRLAEITRLMDEIRVLRHDQRHHLRLIKDMLLENRAEEALSYLTAYEQDSDHGHIQPICSNYVVDVILRRVQAIAIKEGIEAQMQVGIPAESWISDTDLCIVVGNMLENALNACRLVPHGERFLILQAHSSEKEMIITIENSTLTHKPTTAQLQAAGIRAGSGQGISSINALAKKYGGMAQFTHEGTVFKASILMLRPSTLA